MALTLVPAASRGQVLTPRAPDGLTVMFTGSRGGVGTTALAVSVATGLAERPSTRVLFVDASPSQTAACDLASSISANWPGLRVVAVPAGAIGRDEAGFEDAAWWEEQDRLDFIVIDAGPASLARDPEAGEVDLRVIVDDGSVPGVVATRKLLRRLEQQGLEPDRRLVVVNRRLSTFLGALRARDITRELRQAPACWLTPDAGMARLGGEVAPTWRVSSNSTAVGHLTRQIVGAAFAAASRRSPVMPAPAVTAERRPA